MPRYTKGDEWVEIDGARHMPMSAFHNIYEGLATSAPIINRVLKAHNLVDWDGEPVDMTAPLANVSAEQLTFIRDSIRNAITDEALDPEA